MQINRRSIRTISIVFSIILGASAFLSIAPKLKADSEKIYYSDLFFGYDTSYLVSNERNSFFIDFSSDVYSTLREINDVYVDSNDSFWSELRKLCHAL